MILIIMHMYWSQLTDVYSYWMHRSYFKCQRSNCTAKKRAEWSTSEPDNIRVVYEGVHSHALPAPESGSSRPGTDSSLNANQYDLLTQVLGDRSTPSYHDHDHGDNWSRSPSTYARLSKAILVPLEKAIACLPVDNKEGNSFPSWTSTP